MKKLLKKYLNIHHSWESLRHALHAHGLQGGIDFLRKHFYFYKPPAIRFLLELYGFLLSLKPLSIVNNSKKIFILHFCCWGEDYAYKARNFLLPSLLAEGNLPAIAKDYHIILYVHCDQLAKEILFENELEKELKKYATILPALLPDFIFKYYKLAKSYPFYLKRINKFNEVLKYLLLGAFQSQAFYESVQLKAFISFLMPDIILSNNFFLTAMDKIKGKKLVATSTFRTHFAAVEKDLTHFNHDNILSISAADIAKLQVKYLHPEEGPFIISTKTKNFIPCPRMIFPIPNGLLLRALQYHPMLLDCSHLEKPISLDYFPIDDAAIIDILNANIPYQEQVWLCSDTGLMNVMELSNYEKSSKQTELADVAEMTYEGLIKSFCKMITNNQSVYDNQLNHFFIQNKLIFFGNNPCQDINEIINSDVFIHDIYNLLGGPICSS